MWLADYSGKSDFICAIQQTGSDGKVAGISGNVDINTCYKEYSDMDESNVIPSPYKFNPQITYQVKIQEKSWLPVVKNLNNYAGWNDIPITDVAIKVSEGSIKYRVHVLGGRWLDYVTGFNTGDAKNGYAGNGHPIDAIEVYYFTPKGKTIHKAKYRIAPTNGSYFPWQYDNEHSNGQDGYAGVFGKRIGKFQIVLE